MGEDEDMAEASAGPRLNSIAARARILTVPADALDVVLSELDRAFQAAKFSVRVPTSAVDRVYARGSVIGDVLLGGSGASALTTRLGPLAMRADVILATADVQGHRTRFTISLVTGTWDDVGRDVHAATEDALRGAGARGVPITDAGHLRAVDLPPSDPGNPDTASRLGLI